MKARKWDVRFVSPDAPNDVQNVILIGSLARWIEQNPAVEILATTREIPQRRYYDESPEEKSGKSGTRRKFSCAHPKPKPD